MAWTEEQLTYLATVEDLVIVAYREGKPPLTLPIWSVVVDGEAYVRSWRGDTARWYNRVRDLGTGGIMIDGSEHPAVFEFPVSGELERVISEEYLRKYAGFDYAAAMTEAAPVETTLRLLPAGSDA